MGLFDVLKGLPLSIYVIYFNIAMYALCFQMQSPVKPFLVEKLGADKEAYASLASAFGLVQAVGGFLSGPLMDTYGAKPVLMINFAASILIYSLYTFATSVEWLFVAVLPSALQHGMLASSAYISYKMAGDKAKCTQLLGLTGVGYAVGLVIGPALGGAVTKNGQALAAMVGIEIGELGAHKLSALLAVIGSAISLVTTWLFIEHSDDKPKPAVGSTAQAATGQAKGIGAVWASLSQSMRLLASNTPLLHLTLVRGGVTLAGSMVHTSMGPILKEQFGLDAQQLGTVMSIVGVAAIGAQVVVVPALVELQKQSPSKGFIFGRSDGTYTLLGLLGLTASLSWAATCQTVPSFVSALAAMSACGMFLRTMANGQSVAAMPQSSKGAVSAVNMATGSVMRMVAPLASTRLMDVAGLKSVAGGAAAVSGTLFLLLQAGVLHREVEEYTPDEEEEGKKNQ